MPTTTSKVILEQIHILQISHLSKKPHNHLKVSNQMKSQQVKNIHLLSHRDNKTHLKV
jgi:hypothetical protein